MDHHANLCSLFPSKTIIVRTGKNCLLCLLFLALTFSPLKPVLAAPLSAITFSVNTTSDTVDANPGNGICADNAGRCSLRAAITENNFSAEKSTINLLAGIYTLTLANSGGVNEDHNNTGDLDVLASLNIQGAGAASTIIQAGTNESNGIDKVFAINPLCTSPINVTIDGVTIRYGRNTQAYDGSFYSHTGGGLDYCSSGTGGTLTLSNAIVANNSNVNYYGGGLNIDAISPSTITITNVQFLENKTLHASNSANGGAINVLGVQPTLVINNSTFSGNRTENNNAAGGAIYFFPTYDGGILQIHHSTFNNNSAGGDGGGLYLSLNNSTTTVNIDQGTQITNNTSRTAAGGGILINGTTTNPVTLNEVNISDNSAQGMGSTLGGGGVWVGQANVAIQYSRIANNTTFSSNAATGLRKDANAGTVLATNNWWGCSLGPGAAGCDSASAAGGTLTTSPYLQLTASASPSTLIVGQGSGITAGFGLSPANSDGLAGLPVSWTSAGGSLSGQQAVIQSSGTATATYRAASVGPANGVSATVDHATATASLVVQKADSSTVLTSSLNPAVTGETVTFTANVTSTAGLTLNGSVTFSADGTPVCSNIPLSSGTAQCVTSALSAGNHSITALYTNDSNHNQSTGKIDDLPVRTRPAISNILDTTAAEDAVVFTDFTINDADTPLDSLNVSFTSSNLTLFPDGTITLSRTGGNCTLKMIPAANVSGETTITVTVRDEVNLTAVKSYQLTIYPVNDPPVITEGDGPLSITMDEDGDPAAFPPTVLHATDVDSKTLSWSLLSIPLIGIAGVDPSGNVTYTPNPNVSGSDSFIVMVSDGELFDTILVNVTISEIDDFPYKLYLPILFGE